MNILIGITSGIAAYKVVDLIKLLQNEKYEIDVIMTSSATQMVKPETIEGVLGKKVYTDLFPNSFNYKEILKKREVEHVQLADKADLVVIAPATANVLAKMANGIADDFLTTTLLATTAPILVCPSMNVHMWEHPATQENLKTLTNRGIHVLHPDSGALACGYTGVGRLPKIEVIKDEIMKLCHPEFISGSNNKILKQVQNDKNKWFGKKVLVTAGGTSIPIDAVRMITNRASGKMGKEIAEAAHAHGANVVLLRAKAAVSALISIKQELFETPDDLYQLIKKYAADSDIIFHTAAVSDFAPKEKMKEKIDSNTSYLLELVPQRKIIDEIKKINPKIFVVAFKAVVGKSDQEMITIAKEKLQNKKIDAVIVNEVGKSDRGFMVDTNEIIVVQKNKEPVKIPLSSKRDIAQKILNYMSFPRKRESI